MGKKATKNNKPRQQRRTLRTGVLALLVVLGVGTMAGMAAFNANAKPNRDMKWYVREGALEVAAPALGEGYAETAAQSDGTAGEASQTDIVAAQAGEAEPTDIVTAQAVESEPADDFDVLAGIATPEATDAPAATQAPEASETPEPVEPSDPGEPGQVTLTITAAGDCTFGGEEGAKGRRRFLQCVEKLGYEYFFQNVRSVFENDDLTLVNLEGPLTKNTAPTSGEKFVFRGEPDYVNILTSSSVELCNLANNHIRDYGVSGLKETAEVLAANNVGFCGYNQAWYTEIKGVRVGALGFEWWNCPKDKIVAAVKEARGNCDLLIVSMHWGDERVYNYSREQQDLGHAIIDAGADLIIGTHPHVYQGIEKYKGKYIVYSLGNFCFAGNADPTDKRCLIFQQTFSFNPGMGILQANILDQGINILPCVVSSVNNLNNFQPTILPYEEGSALLRAVASRSADLDVNSVRWMKGNYMEVYGVSADAATADLPTEGDAEGDAAAADADEPQSDGPSTT